MKQRSTKKDRGAARAAPSIATLRIPFELLGQMVRGEAVPLDGGQLLPPDLRIVGAARRGATLELKARARWGGSRAPVLTGEVHRTCELCLGPRKPGQRRFCGKPACQRRANALRQQRFRASAATRGRPITGGANALVERAPDIVGHVLTVYDGYNPGNAPEAAATAAPPMVEGGASATSPAAAPPEGEAQAEMDALAEFEGCEDVYAEPRLARAAPATYEGPGRLQVLPPGVSGAELSARRLEAIQPETVWRRGRQLVRVKEVLKAKRKRLGPPVVRVQFVELSLGSALRTISLTEFLRTSYPVLDAGRVEAAS